MQRLSKELRGCLIALVQKLTHKDLDRPTVSAIQLAIPLIRPLSYLGPYSFRSWVMDAICPFLGNFGRAVMTFRQILRTMDKTARAIYRERQVYVANEIAARGSAQFKKTDVLSNLGWSNQMKSLGRLANVKTVITTFKDSSIVLDEAEVLSQINTMVFG